MKQSIKIVLVLTVVCSVCGYLLSLVAHSARQKIEYNQAQALERALYNIVPGLARSEQIPHEEISLYKLFGADEKVLGYGFIAQGQGYAGIIQIMVVINRTLDTLLGIEVVQSQETPGLGQKISTKDFTDQFKNLPADKAIEYTKGVKTDDSQIIAITGATVSSKAVVNILNTYIERIKEILK